MRYTIKWQANSNTYGQFDGNNKSVMCRDARKIVRGNVFLRNTGSWSLYRNDDSQYPEPIKTGSIRN